MSRKRRDDRSAVGDWRGRRRSPRAGRRRRKGRPIPWNRQRKRCGSCTRLSRANRRLYNDIMAKKPTTPAVYVQPYRYPSPNIPMTAIRRFARQIAERFRPEKIILFGSYAYGKPHSESDVDLMVIMRARNVIDQAIRIDLAFEPPFSFDLMVRTPKQIERGVSDDDWFLREVTEKGMVLYEAATVFSTRAITVSSLL
ncbi:MAG TPA: hypothetical protein DDY78_15105 [Planctomycetales bacterium]|nr:hypothetical protein [Planctomycetales bacterium]